MTNYTKNVDLGAVLFDASIIFGDDNQNQGGYNSSVPVVLTGVSVGDLLIAVGVSAGQDATTPFSSSPSETWSEDIAVEGQEPRVYIGSAIATSSGSYTITFTIDATDYPSLWVCRVDGNWDASRLVDTESGSGVNDPTLTLSNLDPSGEAFLILGHADAYTGQDEEVDENAYWTEGCDLDNDGNDQPIRTSYRVVSSGGSYTVAATYKIGLYEEIDWSACAAAYQEAQAYTKEAYITAGLYNMLGWAWGEDDTSYVEIPEIWTTWKYSGGAEARNDGQFGLLQVGTDETFYSDVKDMGNTDAKTLTITIDKYGSGSGTQGTIEWRGSDTSFLWDDVSPSWENYTGEASKTWRYIQVRVSK